MPYNPDKHIVEKALNSAGASPAMLAYWDKDLVCRYANEAYMYWFGVSPAEMIDKMLLKTVLGHLYEKNLKYITGVLNGKPQTFERAILTPRGVTKIARATYIPDIVNGSVNGFYVQVVDTGILKNLGEDRHLSKSVKIPDHRFIMDQLLAEVIQTLKSCIFAEFPGISKLAKKHFISESKLKKDFKEKYRTTIFSFYRSLQMEVAEMYITDKQYTKSQMALMLNFSNPSNFFTCYNKYLKEKAAANLIKEIKQENDQRFKTFVEQVPYEMAMFDTDLNYLVASKLWIDNYHMEGSEYVGKNLFELSPGSKEKFGNIVEACLKGGIYKNEGAPVKRINRPYAWMRWDIRPWYTNVGGIGGLIMITEDITDIKLKEVENRQLTEILEKTSEIGKIGAWSRNFKTKTGFYNQVLKEILELPENFVPESVPGLNFYKEGHSRQLIEKVMNNARDYGESFDVTVDIITAKGNQKTVRVIGYAEFNNGICEKIAGVFHEIKSPV